MVDEITKEKVRKWAETEPLVKSAYIFGSRAGNNFREDSDLDVAVELDVSSGDFNIDAAWILNRKKFVESLESMIPGFELDLQLLDNQNTPTIEKGIKQGSVLIYQKHRQTAS